MGVAMAMLASLWSAAPRAEAQGAVTSTWSWGDDSQGELGDGGDNIDSANAVRARVDDLVQVSAGGFHSLGLRRDGTVWAWGHNGLGQLGVGATPATSGVPVQVVDGAGGFLTDVVAVSAGYRHSLALKADGTVWSWGFNDNGELGNNSTTWSNMPVQVLWNQDIDGEPLVGIVDIGAGALHSVAVSADGQVYAWGQNTSGSLGQGTTTVYDNLMAEPVQGPEGFNTFLDAVAVGVGTAHTLVLRADGSVWSWGLNFYGELGDGTTADKATPVQVLDSNGQPFAGVSEVEGGGESSLAVTEAGGALAWGNNSSGQLGDGSTIARSLAAPVLDATATAPLAGIVAVTSGGAHSGAVLADGSAWTWGSNGEGKLGDGTTTGRLSPVQVLDATGTPLDSVVAIEAGDYHTLAIRDPGTGTVSASVTAADPEACLLVDAFGIDFGQVLFGQSGSSTPLYSVSSCSLVDQQIYVTTNDASNATGTAQWTPGSTTGTDVFRLTADLLDGTGSVDLGPAAAPVGTLAPDGVASGQQHTLHMPSVGSSGGGETLSFDITWIAVAG